MILAHLETLPDWEKAESLPDQRNAHADTVVIHNEMTTISIGAK